MITLLGSALPVVLQIIGWFLGKSAASDEIKKNFLTFVSSYESGTGNAVRLGDSARSQLDKLKEELKDGGSPPQ